MATQISNKTSGTPHNSGISQTGHFIPLQTRTVYLSTVQVRKTLKVLNLEPDHTETESTLFISLVSRTVHVRVDVPSSIVISEGRRLATNEPLGSSFSCSLLKLCYLATSFKFSEQYHRSNISSAYPGFFRLQSTCRNTCTDIINPDHAAEIPGLSFWW